MIPNFSLNNINSSGFSNDKIYYESCKFNDCLSNENQIERIKSKLKVLESFLKEKIESEFSLNKSLKEIDIGEFDLHKEIENFKLKMDKSINSSQNIINERRKVLNAKIKELNMKNKIKKNTDVEEVITNYISNFAKKDLELLNKY